MEVKQMVSVIAGELQIAPGQVERTIALLDEGSTVPFIARYRKEATGMLDENQIRSIQERVQYLRQLEERKKEVIRLIAEQEKLTDELEEQIRSATRLQQVEDLYRPFRQKRRTRATIAKEKGLDPLAQFMLTARKGNLLEEAAKYIDPEKGVASVEEAVQGASDIVAEQVADDPGVRSWVRDYTMKRAVLSTVKKEDEPSGKNVYEMYYEYSEQVGQMAPHRILAVNRAEREGILRVKLELDPAPILQHLERKWIRRDSIAAEQLRAVLEDSYKRLIAPAVEREVRGLLTEKAEEQAIHIFSENLRQLLLQAPLKNRVVLALDPAFRTGCKSAVIDETGKLLEVAVVYPTPPQNKIAEAKRILSSLIEKYGVQIIAIGNGTASRETEQFVVDMIKEIKRDLSYIIVNEAGASVYSASKLAGEEFPDLDVAERSAVSIGRRLQDPLAELVKIDPKSIGVGQYQHDVSQSKLSDSLQFVVESVVNYVGVDVNTASPSLLQYVSGISKQVAKNIVARREELGKYTSRSQLKEVPRLGAKTYEQCIGFLRIIDGENPLDSTPIHPESYQSVAELLKELGIRPEEIGSEQSRVKFKEVNIKEMAQKLNVGEPTLQDIVASLLRPGRDPREELNKPLLKKDVLDISDLAKGMELQGTVRNVVDFGAFVDIGLKNDGLVHISQLSRRFVKHPLDVVSVGEIVTVWVKDIDERKGRVGLTMLAPEE
ncbi:MULTISPECIES: Tex family protein [Aneurinibacillus]|uniref:RNA-binding transcriptional accessory protein n=1 Tax=Aneurinibacillus danicus TaxID=267746 RepID=A0A511VFB5_9BACL|nr:MULTISPECIES: Tex family protein [Aneurinibacillus]GEN36243.1 RNA-binding transcriptional accessory protein [Aneurinibacillus danicus]